MADTIENISPFDPQRQVAGLREILQRSPETARHLVDLAGQIRENATAAAVALNLQEQYDIGPDEQTARLVAGVNSGFRDILNTLAEKFAEKGFDASVDQFPVRNGILLREGFVATVLVVADHPVEIVESLSSSWSGLVFGNTGRLSPGINLSGGLGINVNLQPVLVKPVNTGGEIKYFIHDGQKETDICPLPAVLAEAAGLRIKDLPADSSRRIIRRGKKQI